jgi:hypothetical protein
VEEVLKEEERTCSVKFLKDLRDFIKHIAYDMDCQDGYDSDNNDDTSEECDCLPPCKECRRKK